MSEKSHNANAPMTYEAVFEITDRFNASLVSYWLIGGYAIELIAGERIRDHSDVDFMVDLRDADRAVGILNELCYESVKGSLAEGLVYYERGSAKACVVPIDSSLDPPAAVGGFQRINFPKEFLDTLYLQIDSRRIPTLRPRMHVLMKHIIADFFGSGDLRDKDRVDIQHLNDLQDV